MCLMPTSGMIPRAILPSARAVMVQQQVCVALGEALARLQQTLPTAAVQRSAGQLPDNVAEHPDGGEGNTLVQRGRLVLASHARQFALRNGTGGPLRFDEGHLRRLVSSFVHDTICNRNYYASEHFLTQTALMSQPLDPKSGIPTVPISDVVHTEDVQRSGSVDYERLMGALGIRATGEHHARAAECYARASTDGNVASSKRGIRALPRAAALLRIVNADPSVQSLLCAVYYADFVCLGYQLPAICNATISA